MAQRRKERGTWGLPVLPRNIPDVLKRAHRWTCWRAVPKTGGKPGMDKVPCTVLGRGMHLDRLDEYESFDACMEAYDARGIIHGVGFGLKDARTEKGHYLVAGDLDHCVVDGVVDPEVLALLEELGSYWELSPSGKGVRFFLAVRGGLPQSFRGPTLQLFAGAGFVSTTGHRGESAAHGVRVWEVEALEALLEPWRPAKGERLELGKVPDLLQGDDLPEPPEWLDDAAEEVLTAEDRSSALSALAAQLLRHGDPDVVLSWLAHSAAFQVALDHRRDSPTRALEYLWRHHCSQDVVGVSAEDFDEHGGGDRDRENLGTGKHPPKDALGTALLAPASSLSAKAAPAEWILEGLIERKQVVLVVAEESVGKTFVMLDMAAAIVQGIPWCGFQAGEGLRAGYVSAEGSSGFLRRLRVLEAHASSLDGLFAHAGVVTLSMRADNRLRLTDGFRALVDEVKRLKLDVLFVDTFSTCKGDVEENSNSEVAWFLGQLRHHLVEECGCALVLVHHTRKDGDVFRGASALSNNSDVRFELHREENLRVLFQAPKLRDSADVGEIRLRLAPAQVGDIESLRVLPVSQEEVVQEMQQTQDGRKQVIFDALGETRYENNPPSAYTLALNLRREGMRWALLDVVKELLKELEEELRVAQVPQANDRHANRAPAWVQVVLPQEALDLLS